MRRLPLLVRSFGIAALFLVAALLGTAGGVLFAFAGDLPAITALDDYSPGTITRVLGRDGSVIGSFATERRQIVTYDQISPRLREAIISAEDGDFMHHGGIEAGHMILAYIQDRLWRRHTPGRSTITQQLARQLFPESVGFERTPERKIKEALVALQIEKRYTKQEILTMYCNKVAWGYGTYGVEAASQFYFNKSAKDVTLGEAATIAGILPSPQRWNPFSNMKAAVVRRNYTLDNMVENGYITADQAAAAKKAPIVTRGEPSRPASVAPYFLEAIRQQLDDRYGSKAVYEGGLVVRTGLDPALQQAANDALDRGVRRLDKLRGYRKPARNILAEKQSLDTYRNSRWSHEPAAGEIMPALVTGLDASDLHVRVGRFTGLIHKAGYQWTGKKPAALARVGDLVEVRVASIDSAAGTLTATLDQPPVLEGAVLAIDNHTGQILAMVGGDSFERSQFNRAVQAQRQVGSLFKPFVFTAAIDRGYTAQSLLDDSPVSFDVGPDQPRYEPQNYDHEYHGPVTIREALEDSRNVPTVRLMDALGPPEVIKYARQLGVMSPLPAYLSIAIGAAEGNLLEMVSAYSAFPNQGVRMAPLLLTDVVDRDGNTLEQHRAEPHEAIRADTAYIMTNLLEGVIEHGTGAEASQLNWPLGGKTGTTDDYTDAWFVGFDPDITLGVWVGFDQKRPIGHNQTGAVAALPIWEDIMRTWVARRRAALPSPPSFERPGNVVTVPTDKGPEVFIAGTEPQQPLPMAD
jgi:penicillin-binding protein 1A